MTLIVHNLSHSKMRLKNIACKIAGIFTRPQFVNTGLHRNDACDIPPMHGGFPSGNWLTYFIYCNTTNCRRISPTPSLAYFTQISLIRFFGNMGCLDSITHWGRVTHICVGKLTTIDSDNGLSPGRRQAIIWTNAGILLIGPLGTNFSEILIGIQTFSFKKMLLKMSSAKWRPFVSASMSEIDGLDMDVVCCNVENLYSIAETEAFWA